MILLSLSLSHTLPLILSLIMTQTLTLIGLLRILYPLAALRIQTAWRRIQSRVIRKKWRFLTFRLGLLTLP
jgi:hypothetical protein